MRQERREVLTQKVRNWMRTHDCMDPFTFGELTKAFELHDLKQEQKEVKDILGELSHIDNDTMFEDINGEKCKIIQINIGKQFARAIRKGNTIWQLRDVCQYFALPVGCTFKTNPINKSNPDELIVNGKVYKIAA